MTGAELDPTFTALPYRALGDTALDRARVLGVSHADFRFERVRYQHLGVRDGVLQGAADSEDVGFAVRVIHRGAWGFAAGVVLTPEEDDQIDAAGVGQGMPEGWQSGDLWARYRAAGLDLEGFAPLEED